MLLFKCSLKVNRTLAKQVDTPKATFLNTLKVFFTESFTYEEHHLLATLMLDICVPKTIFFACVQRACIRLPPVAS